MLTHFLIFDKINKMDTLIKKLNFLSIKQARELILDGGIVAFPTETVYGLGASVFDEEAIASIFEAKGRPQDNPLIAHIADKHDVFRLASVVPADARKVIGAFMPGSITIVLPKKSSVPDIATGGLDTIAVRMPKCKETRRFIAACGVPIVAPSANTSGRPSPTTAEEVYADMNGKIPLILKGKKCEVGIESTVVDFTSGVPVILRPGVITASDIESVIGKKVEILTDTTQKVNSPGVRYKHYAPTCPCILNTDGDVAKVCAHYADKKAEGLNPVVMCLDGLKGELVARNLNVYGMGESERDFARNLYGALRTLEKDYDYIIIVWDLDTEFADSVFNRLERVAAHNML